jgi:hypothetical protein
MQRVSPAAKYGDTGIREDTRGYAVQREDSHLRFQDKSNRPVCRFDNRDGDDINMDNISEVVRAAWLALPRNGVGNLAFFQVQGAAARLPGCSGS